MILSAIQTEQIALLRIDGATVGCFDSIAEATSELLRHESEICTRYPGARLIQSQEGQNLTVCIILPSPKRIDLIRRAVEAIREEQSEMEMGELMLEAS